MDERAPRYRVTRLYDADGNVAPHFVGDEFHAFCDSWETAMAMPQFAAVIEREIEAEQVADAPLEHLSAFAPNDRVRLLYLDWLAFMDGELDPWTTGGAIHFRPHWARVLLHALVIADRMGLGDGDLKALAMAAVFHDTRRQTPYLDTGHGARASAYYEQACAAAEPGSLLALDPRTALAIAWHDRDDEDGIEAAERLAAEMVGSPGADPQTILRIFKDSDALDRVRLGEGGLDTRYLRTETAREQVAFAEELFTATRQ